MENKVDLAKFVKYDIGDTVFPIKEVGDIGDVHWELELPAPRKITDISVGRSWNKPHTVLVAYFLEREPNCQWDFAQDNLFLTKKDAEAACKRRNKKEEITSHESLSSV